jgi:hypothetical protein
MTIQDYMIKVVLAKAVNKPSWILRYLAWWDEVFPQVDPWGDLEVPWDEK